MSRWMADEINVGSVLYPKMVAKGEALEGLRQRGEIWCVKEGDSELRDEREIGWPIADTCPYVLEHLICWGSSGG